MEKRIIFPEHKPFFTALWRDAAGTDRVQPAA
jgi:hypothetical protein